MPLCSDEWDITLSKGTQERCYIFNIDSETLGVEYPKENEEGK